jgi:hypothetical protein
MQITPPDSRDDWTDLFQPASQAAAAVGFRWRVLKKAGKPFLVLPEDHTLARQGLKLYPAQSAFARAAKTLLQLALQARLSVAGEKVRLAIRRDDELLRFLAGQTNCPVEQLRPPAILAGNPAAPGRRFILLAFGPNGRPAAVLKAGLNETARQLVERETSVLSALPRSLAGAPGLRGSFHSPRLRLLAQNYFPGDSPRTTNPRIIGTLLASWLNTDQRVPLTETPLWRRLAEACRASSVFSKLAERLDGKAGCPAIYHGDFVPWNVKVSPEDGSWTVLDWERGELEGIPAWDWFHYVIQRAILVRRLAVKGLMTVIESLLAAEPFQAYAHQAGIGGVERPLLLGYLLYNNEVIRPAEGLPQAKKLFAVLQSQW